MVLKIVKSASEKHTQTIFVTFRCLSCQEQSHDASYLMQESASTVEALSSHRWEHCCSHGQSWFGLLQQRREIASTKTRNSMTRWWSFSLTLNQPGKV
eukprot:850721-Amphidinium_carterae.1